MLKKRIIPCLDIKNGKVVKGINFLDLAEVGDPVEYAKEYERQCADEIVFLDITASFEERGILEKIITRAASELSIPLTVGGGIRSIADFRNILKHGADKVSINSSAVYNPNLIRQASAEFGSQCVVVAVDAKRIDGKFVVFVKGGREQTSLELLEWAAKCEELGAGEILLTSMDTDGVQTGYDVEMTKAVTELVNIPVIASGGCGTIEHVADVFKQTDCDAALISSLFHYKKATVGEVKVYMEKEGIHCRKLH